MFKWGKFTGASGQELDYKIICDRFTPEDWDCLARIVIQKMHAEGRVIDFAVGVPSGGIAFAAAMNTILCDMRMFDTPGGQIIVCEDVWTTGGSARSFIEQHNYLKDTTNISIWTAFARGPIGGGARAIFYTEEAD